MITRFVILAGGHSGSTLVSGIFIISGFPTLGWPTGVCESVPLNDLNETLIGRSLDRPLHIDQTNVTRFINMLEKRTKGNWSLKDPYLPFTFPIIYPMIRKPIKIIFNFRNPCTNVDHNTRSMLKYHKYLDSHHAKAISEKEWYKKNKAILSFIDEHKEIPFLMLDYDDLLSGKNYEVINRFVGKGMNYLFVDKRKSRAKGCSVGSKLEEMYRELTYRAEVNHKIIMDENGKVQHTPFLKKLLPYITFRLSWKLLVKMRKLLYPRPGYLRIPFSDYTRYLQQSGINVESYINSDL